MDNPFPPRGDASRATPRRFFDARRWPQAVAIALAVVIAMALSLRPTPRAAAPLVLPAVDALHPGAAPPASSTVPPAAGPRAWIAAVVRELGELRTQRLPATPADRVTDEVIRRTMGAPLTQERLRDMLERLIVAHEATPRDQRAALWADVGHQPGLARAWLYLAEDLEDVDRNFKIREGFAPRFLARAAAEDPPNPLLWLTYARWLLCARSLASNATPEDASVRLAGHLLAHVAMATADAGAPAPGDTLIALLLFNYPRDSWEPGDTERGDAQKIWRNWRVALMHSAIFRVADRRASGPHGPALVHLHWRQFSAHQMVYDVVYATALFARVVRDLKQLDPLQTPLLTRLRVLEGHEAANRDMDALYKRVAQWPEAAGDRQVVADLHAVDHALHAILPIEPASEVEAAALVSALITTLDHAAANLAATTEPRGRDVVRALSALLGADALMAFVTSDLAKRLPAPTARDALDLARAYRALFLAWARANWTWAERACPDELVALAVAAAPLERLTTQALRDAKSVAARISPAAAVAERAARIAAESAR